MNRKRSWLAGSVFGALILAMACLYFLGEDVLFDSPIRTGAAVRPNEVSTSTRDGALRISLEDLINGKSLGTVTGEQVLSAYERGYRGMGDGALQFLESVQALGLQPSERTAETVLRLLRSAPSSKEKAQLAKIYGSLYHQTDDVTLKESIRKELASLVRQGQDADVVQAAVLTYSRLGLFPDSLDLLTQAHAAGFISENDCFGDFAHLLPLASADGQAEILARLQLANNAFSKDVLASHLSRNETAQALSPEARERATEFLGAAEPVFEGSPFEFGMFDAIRYEKWLTAMANLTDQGQGGRSSYLANRLTRPDLDPRVYLAVLMTPESANAAVPSLTPAQAATIDNSISRYAGMYPDASMLQEAATAARQNLRQRGGRH